MGLKDFSLSFVVIYWASPQKQFQAISSHTEGPGGGGHTRYSGEKERGTSWGHCGEMEKREKRGDDVTPKQVTAVLPTILPLRRCGARLGGCEQNDLR